MRVFISWSGDRSKAVAHALREWLPAAISSINPWMSDDDILSGSRWNDEIKQQLASADVGVLCFTKENLAAPWLLFEAGALSRRPDGESYVIPYLVDLQIREIPAGPLTAFHAVCADEKGTKSLLRTMNAAISKNPGEPVLESVTFERVFTNNWPSLEADLKRIAEDPSYEATPKNEGPTLPDMVAEILVEVREIGRRTSESPVIALAGTSFGTSGATGDLTVHVPTAEATAAAHPPTVVILNDTGRISSEETMQVEKQFETVNDLIEYRNSFPDDPVTQAISRFLDRILRDDALIYSNFRFSKSDDGTFLVQWDEQ